MTSKSPFGDISVVTLIRTYTTLDYRQKAEKVWLCWSAMLKLVKTLDKKGTHTGRRYFVDDVMSAMHMLVGTPDTGDTYTVRRHFVEHTFLLP